MTLDEAEKLAADGKLIIHELKCLPAYFDAMERGDKRFDVRRDDRGFQKGDVLRLREWDDTPTAVSTGTNPWTRSRGYTGGETHALVRFVLTGGQFGIEPGFVVMGFEPIEE